MFFLLITLIINMTLSSEENKSIHKNKDFSITPLYDSDNQSGELIMMKLKTTNGFAPNVNVAIQSYAKSLEEYQALTVIQIAKLKLKVLKSEIKDNVLTLEYSGTMKKINFHWYANAYKKDNKMYLVTATSKETQWKTVSKKLTDCVNSFKLNKNK